MKGVIAAAGFASGDRFVVGHWSDTPLGPITDVMWAQPDGSRVLLVPDVPSGEFISSIYTFDAVRIVPTSANGGDRWIEVTAGPVELQLKAGVGWRIPFPRPPWFTRLVEDPIARAALGVRTYGRSPSGVRTWYRADVHRPVTAGWATIDGRDLGAFGPLEPACGFGFTEAPRRPSVVSVRPLLEDPSGRLDEVVRAAARARVKGG
jgi:hypothetical protein